MSKIGKVLRRCRAEFVDHTRAFFDADGHGRYLRLRKSVHSPDYHVNVLADWKTIYFDIPKAACTTIKILLSERLGGGCGCDPVEVHPRAKSGIPGILDVGPHNFFSVADDPEALIFTFVRNPYARIVSCFRDKVERHPLGRRGPFSRDIRAFFGQRLDVLDPGKPLPFEWFVEMACATSRDTSNGHWLTMDRLLPQHDVVCTFVGRVENFDSDIRVVCERLKMTAPRQKMNATGKVRISEWLTPSIKDAIRSAYREDFDRFAYSTTVPD